MKQTFLHCILTVLFFAVTGSVRAEVITIPTTGSIDPSKMVVSHNSMRDVAGQITNFEYNHWIKMDVQTATTGDYELKISIQSTTNNSSYSSSFRVTTSIPEVDVEWAGDAANAGKYDEALVVVSPNSKIWKDYHILFHNVPANQVMTIRLDVVTTPADAISCGNLKDFKITNVSSSNFQVTYDLNYTGAPSPKEMSYFTSSSCPVLKYPVRSGYKCNGWYTATSGGEKYTTVSSNRTLYAQWESIVQDIPNTNFDYTKARVSNDNMFSNSSYISIQSGQTAEYEMNATEAGDYDFQFKAGGSPSIMRLTASNENIVFDWVGDNNNRGDYDENDKVTISYVYSLSSFKTYHVVMRKVPVGKFIVKITGLYNTSNLNSFAIQKKSEITPSYTLTYDLNDNGTSSDKKVKDYYVNNAKIINNPARYGYKFLGWYDQRSGGSKYADNKTFSTSDNGKTIYAQWEKLEGSYQPIDGKANVVSNFSFSNGMNAAKLGENTGVYVGGTYDGQKSHKTTVSFEANTPITVKFPESFKNYDNQLYDIVVTLTCNVAVTQLESKLEGSAPNYFISLSPDKSISAMKAMSQHVEMWLEKNGTKVTDVNFVAGCCYMSAREETLSVYGNSNTLYSNVPAEILGYSSKGWAPIDASYNQPFYYFIGNGLSPDHSIEMDYTRTAGGCEFMIGYIKYTYTFVCPSRDNVNVDVQMNGAPQTSGLADWMNNVVWTANVDIKTNDNSVIAAGTPMNTSDLANTVATSDVIFTGIESEQITDKPGAGQSLADFQAAVQGRLLAMKGVPYNITINRTIWRDGYYNTLCLPFSLSAADLEDEDCPLYGFTELKQFTDAEVQGSGNNRVLIINIDDATEIEAGKPYLIKYDEAATNIENPVFENITVTETEGQTVGDAVQFKGILVPTQLDINNKDYLFVGEKSTLYWPNTNNPLRGFRAYFYVDSKQPAASAIRRNMAAQFGSGRQTPTGMNVNVNANANQIRKLVEQGRVVIRQDGQIFDLNGRVVK